MRGSFEVVFWVGIGIVVSVLVIIQVVDYFDGVVKGECWSAMGKQVNTLLDGMGTLQLNAKYEQRVQVRSCAGTVAFVDRAEAVRFSQYLEGLDLQAGEVRSACPAEGQAYAIAVPYLPETDSWYGVKFWELGEDAAENVRNWYLKNVRALRPFCKAFPGSEMRLSNAEPVVLGDNSGETKDYCVTAVRDSLTSYKVTATQATGAC